jgi:hypothetical protein
MKAFNLLIECNLKNSLTPYPPKGGLLNSIIFRCSPLGLGVKQMKIIEFTTFPGKLLLNVCSSCKIAIWAIFTVVHLSAEKPNAKVYLNKALAFVKSIWLPLGSNYLIYSDISPGLTGFASGKIRPAEHSQTGLPSYHFNNKKHLLKTILL